MSVLKLWSDGERITSYRLLMMTAWVASPILYYLNIFFTKMHILGLKGSFVIPLFIIILSIKAWREIKIQKISCGVIAYLLFVLIFIFTYAFYPNNGEYLDKEFSMFFFHVTPYVFVGLLLDIKRFQKSFTVLSAISVFTHALYQIWYVPQIHERTGLMEDMVGAYLILPHVLFLLYAAFKTKNPITITVAALSLLFLMSMGNRGSTVCVMTFFAIVFVVPKSGKHSNFTRALALIVVGVLIYYSQQIALYLSDLFLNYGLSNRVFDLLLTNEFLVSKGRDNISNTLIEAILNGPVFGYGLCGDRVASGAVYAHNFFLEVLADFGFFFGTILNIAFIVLCVKAFAACRSREEYVFMAILAANFTGMLFSGSLMEDYQWAFLLGAAMRLVLNKEVKKDGSVFQKKELGLANI